MSLLYVDEMIRHERACVLIWQQVHSSISRNLLSLLPNNSDMLYVDVHNLFSLRIIYSERILKVTAVLKYVPLKKRLPAVQLDAQYLLQSS
jgi:hypothetical protein